MFDNIKTILIHTSHPGNIGAAARALKNMGFTQLTLVSPKDFPSPEAQARASHAEDLLEKASVVSTLKEALKGCRLIFGTSGRARTLSLPILTPREAAKIILSSLSEKNNESEEKNEEEGENDNKKIGTDPTTKAAIAILYGNEQHGLTNEELDFCHYQIQIPTHSNYASINLAAAVQIISYELFSSYSSNFILTDTLENENDKISLASLPTSENLAEFYKSLEKLLVEINFLNPMQPGYLMTRLKQLFSRAQLDKTELTLLRGIISAIQQKLL